jgi:hypothetical protein
MLHLRWKDKVKGKGSGQECPLHNEAYFSFVTSTSS